MAGRGTLAKARGNADFGGDMNHEIRHRHGCHESRDVLVCCRVLIHTHSCISRVFHIHRD